MQHDRRLFSRRGNSSISPLSRSIIVLLCLATFVLTAATMWIRYLQTLELVSCVLGFSIAGVQSHAIKQPPHTWPNIPPSRGNGSVGAETNPTGDHVYGDGKLGAVASESSICSGIGKDLLLRGGNAADALVGTTFCVGVIGMYHSGIGGGGFMLVRGSDGEYEYIDFRETAPAAAFRNMYNNDTDASIYGGLAR